MDTIDAVESSRRLWKERFPQEKYHLDLSQFHYHDQRQPSAPSDRASRIEYNLKEAVIRQSTFYYQVSQPHMKEQCFLRAAEQRYKGFLHLFRLTGCNVFLVPTYDIDLMWHAHQLNPEAYAQDLTHILGRVLEHDDTDSDRSPGKKLQEGFLKTCQQWQEHYGMVYQRAGTMYRGEPPTPLQLSWAEPDISSIANKPTITVGLPYDFTLLAPRELMQVFVTVVKARNVPRKGGKYRVRLQMERKCKSFKLETASIPYLSEVTWNHTWTFEVEKSTESLRLVLLRKRQCALKQKVGGSEILGEASLSWQILLSTPTLSYDGWLSILPIFVPSGTIVEMPPSLFVSVSLTPPRPGPQLFRTIKCIPTDDSRCMVQESAKHGCWLTKTVIDHTSRVVFIIRAKHSIGGILVPEDERCFHIHQGEWGYPDIYSNVGTAPAKIVASAQQVITEWDTKATLSAQRCWGFFDNTSQLTVSRVVADPLWNVRPLLEIHGSLRNQIHLICGRKLDYEVKGATDKDEGGFVTLIRRSAADAPLGKATALFNWRTGAMEVSPNESITLVLLLSNIISTSVYDMEGLIIKLQERRAPVRQSTSYDQWGAVVLTRKDGSSMTSRRDAMMPYYCWWDMSPMIWATDFYNPRNTLLGASGCGAAGACGGACGGSACGGAGGCGGGCGGGGCGGG